VRTVATTVFFLCYAIATGVLALASRRNKTPFAVTSVVVALLAAFTGSALSFFVLLIAFGPS
jgi:hypothetical protein